MKFTIDENPKKESLLSSLCWIAMMILSFIATTIFILVGGPYEKVSWPWGFLVLAIAAIFFLLAKKTKTKEIK